MSELKVIIVSGLPCIGKSTIANEISRNYKYPIFSVDPIESSILESGIKRSFETGLSAYLITKNLANEQLSNRVSVVIDAVSPVKEAREMWDTVSKNNNAKLYIIECVLDENIHKIRAKNRQRNMIGIPEVTWEYIEEIKKIYLPWNKERLIIDTNNDLEINIKLVNEFLKS